MTPRLHEPGRAGPSRAEPGRSHLSKSLQGSVLCLSGSTPIWPLLELLLADFHLRWTPGNVLKREEKKKRNRF